MDTENLHSRRLSRRSNSPDAKELGEGQSSRIEAAFDWVRGAMDSRFTRALVALSAVALISCAEEDSNVQVDKPGESEEGSFLSKLPGYEDFIVNLNEARIQITGLIEEGANVLGTSIYVEVSRPSDPDYGSVRYEMDVRGVGDNNGFSASAALKGAQAGDVVRISDEFGNEVSKSYVVREQFDEEIPGDEF